MLVEEMKSTYENQYDEEFLRVLPERCFNPSCNSPMEISPVLTKLQCSNPRCPDKVVRRITSLMNDLGVKQFGGARAAQFVRKFGIKNPLSIFQYELCDGTLGADISEKVSQMIFEQIDKKRSFTLSEYVRAAHLPFIQTSAVILFSEYDDLAEAYKPIEEGGISYIKDKLGIQKGGTSDEDFEDEFLESTLPEVSLRAMKVYESLMLYKEDLFSILPYVNIVKTNSGDVTSLSAVCSEAVGAPFVSKADFYSTVNSMYPDIHVDFLKSATKSVDYLVWAGADGNEDSRVTNKVKKVQAWNEEARAKGGKIIPIVTASQFLEILKGLRS